MMPETCTHGLRMQQWTGCKPSIFQGVDEAFDAACAAAATADDGLKRYLAEVKQLLGGKPVKYVSLNKDSHLLEVRAAGGA